MGLGLNLLSVSEIQAKPYQTKRRESNSEYKQTFNFAILWGAQGESETPVGRGLGSVEA